MRTIACSQYYWYDYEALKLFNQYGVQRFIFDDIWNFNWEACRLDALKNNYDNIPDKPIIHPMPLLEKVAGQQLVLLDNLLMKMKKTIRGRAQ